MLEREDRCWVARSTALGDDRAPSQNQKALWYLQRLSPESPAYNIGVLLRLSPVVDACILRDALGALMRRHDSLRTSFVVRDDQLVRRVHPNVAARLAVVD